MIIDTVMGVANSIFADIEAFGFSRTSVQTINGLIANSPKVMIALEAKKARERILKRQDQAERQFPDKKESEEIDPADFSTKLSIGFRSMEIIGQLLKNHYAKFEAAPKRALYLSAVNVA